MRAVIENNLLSERLFWFFKQILGKEREKSKIFSIYKNENPLAQPGLLNDDCVNDYLLILHGVDFLLSLFLLSRTL